MAVANSLSGFHGHGGRALLLVLVFFSGLLHCLEAYPLLQRVSTHARVNLRPPAGEFPGWRNLVVADKDEAAFLCNTRASNSDNDEWDSLSKEMTDTKAKELRSSSTPPQKDLNNPPQDDDKFVAIMVAVATLGYFGIIGWEYVRLAFFAD
mmetsp:Transcript_12240/g.18842  ORF Transcript_12240/g.18842 Transcript_12240/m.18842 type:complete len:151 (-) Transcript_12240:141-593(-)